MDIIASCLWIRIYYHNVFYIQHVYTCTPLVSVKDNTELYFYTDWNVYQLVSVNKSYCDKEVDGCHGNRCCHGERVGAGCPYSEYRPDIRVIVDLVVCGRKPNSE